MTETTPDAWKMLFGDPNKGTNMSDVSKKVGADTHKESKEGKKKEKDAKPEQSDKNGKSKDAGDKKKKKK